MKLIVFELFTFIDLAIYGISAISNDVKNSIFPMFNKIPMLYYIFIDTVPF